MRYKTYVGALSSVASIVKYSDDEKSWQIFAPTKNGKHQSSWHRKDLTETIPIDDITRFATYSHGKSKSKGAFTGALVGDALFGTAGAVGGAILAQHDVGAINEIGFAFDTQAGDEYIIPVFISIKATPINKTAAKTAIDTLQAIGKVFTDHGTPYDDQWRQRLSTFS